MKKYLLTALIFAGALFTVKAQIKIVSGVMEGSYHRIANDIKERVDEIDIEVIESGGSTFNYDELIASDASLISLMQYDVLIYKNMENAKETNNIKILLPLDYEEIHLVAYKETGITSLEDLEGKKVAIGSPEQGTNITAKLIKQQTGIEWEDVEIGFNDAFVGLLVGTVDAFFFVGAVPVTKLKDLSPEFSNLLNLVPIESPALDRIYDKTRIRAFSYKWSKENINTYAVASVIAVNTKGMTKKQQNNIDKLLIGIRDNMDELKKTGHPKWRRVDFNYDDFELPVYNNVKEIFNQKE